MASQPAKTADDLTTAIRSLVDKALESQTREQIAARGREVAAAIAETAGTAAERASEIANDVWRESAPQRREAETPRRTQASGSRSSSAKRSRRHQSTIRGTSKRHRPPPPARLRQARSARRVPASEPPKARR